MLTPASGPMPGSMPTSVPVTQPRNAYHSTSGRNATEKPRRRLSKVASTRLEPDQAARERRFEQRREQEIREHGHTDAEGGRREEGPALDREQQAEEQQAHGDDEAEPAVERDGDGG